MARFDYRGFNAQGGTAQGRIEASDRNQAAAGVRRLGVTPVMLAEVQASGEGRKTRVDRKSRAAAAKAIGELGVLISAGLPLDRALALTVENIDHPGVAQEFGHIIARVKDGRPLSLAMAERGALFPPTAQAMTEAGEANGRLGDALNRLSASFDQAEEMRRLIVGASIYPCALLIIAIGVILMMLLFVVPQFEALFATAPPGKLPASSVALMAASRGLRQHGLAILAALVVMGVIVRQLLRRPGVAIALDRGLLRVPQLGMLIRYIETARFARTLGALIEGEVPLPAALAMARRSIANRVMGDAIAAVATGVKEGGALTARLAAAKVLPRIALGFFRTGEETSQLGMMLTRLADVLDRDVTLRIQRLVAILTPIITVSLGGIVAAIIASIMTAILGFNDLAVSQ